ncbi:hypothetical protein GUITHDRAFT_134985 [Guillardia theta CCMP2712]|uniref:FZ domain-containing protein n=1 Tax=Guillardia theta (strain CCMP2712) TaxID=905079 RepID=L1JR31_GUITC|nr:hypothetical protein GUITHDRAFT_134985 [Guillardia theta CCMP2712]EKX50892.1 hypothetical protein GUITHDRAFT_134985 [Guillardia theta CCMP2712]|eukprot:XP_005837872.1 hypothetical protein GUITHDRAFT_134985 [Guillardia theta CCMP2712]
MAWARRVLLVVVAAWLASGGESSCRRREEDLQECDMLDYMVYDSVNLQQAEAQARQIVGAEIPRWKESGKGGMSLSGDFCEQLFRAVTCNLLIPPCEGDGSERYRKPCRAYQYALELGCHWKMQFGDLAFAEPPDCYELPVKNYYEEGEFLDAEELGSSKELNVEGRVEDLVKLARILETHSKVDHAVHLYLQVLRYRPDNAMAHKRIFSLVHASEERSLSLEAQLNFTNQRWNEACDDKGLPKGNKYQKHKGLAPDKKVKYILDYKAQTGAEEFYETGVWYGETLNGIKDHFPRIKSIEISSQIADMARKRFQGHDNIQIITGDSVDVLPVLLEKRDRSKAAIFWLDGHFSGSRFETSKSTMDTPELFHTLQHVHEQDTILIDDARLFRGYRDCAGDFESECFPSLRDLKSVLCKYKPDWTFTVEDDLIRMSSAEVKEAVMKKSKKSKKDVKEQKKKKTKTKKQQEVRRKLEMFNSDRARYAG